MPPMRLLGRSIRTSTLRLVTIVGVTMAILVPGSAALAEPTASEIEAQIDAAWSTLEPTIEEYNKVHADLEANQTKYDELKATLEPLQLEVDLALSKIGDIASQAYKAGGTTSGITAILNSDSPENLLDQMSMLNQMSKTQTAQIDETQGAVEKYEADQAALDTLLADLTQQDTDLAAKKTEIETQIDDLQDLWEQVATTATSSYQLAACPSEYTSGAAGTAATRACDQIGDPYVYGTDGPSSFDCSGLTKYAWANSVTLYHNAAQQYSDITHVTRANLQIGDLVFYHSPISHVAIYVGGGYVVHAPQTGDYVRMALIDKVGSPTGYGRPA